MCHQNAEPPTFTSVDQPHFDAQSQPSTGSRQRRIWDLPHQCHCPLVGICLPIDTLRKLVNKALGGQTRSEPVHDLRMSKIRKAKWTNCRLVLRCRSQFFHNRLHFSSQAKDRSTTQRCAITTKVCKSLRLAICTVAPSSSLTAWANSLPV